MWYPPHAAARQFLSAAKDPSERLSTAASEADTRSEQPTSGADEEQH
jgi:hypothetical protein